MNYEKALLSRILFNDEWGRVLDKKVTPELFGDAETRDVFMFISKFYNDYGKVPSIDLIEQEFPNLSLPYAKEPCEYYIDKMTEVYVRNKGSKLLLDHARLLVTKPLEGLKRIREGVLALSVEAEPTRDVDLVKSTKDRMERYLRIKNAGGVDGYSTPWKVLDEATMGMHGGEFFAIVSRPGLGKTFMLTIFADHAFRSGLKSLFITNEMSIDQILQRFDAVHFKLPYREFRAGLLPDALEQRYFEGLEKMAKAEQENRLVVVSDVSGVSSIGAKIDQYKPDVVFIDGLYLLSDDRAASSKWESITNISRDIKKLARKKNIPIVATTQFNRAADSISMDKVTLSNLGFSDSIGQDADVVLGLFRTKDMEMNNELAVRMLKVREGEPNDFTLLWDLRNMRFTVLDTNNDRTYLDDSDEPLDF